MADVGEDGADFADVVDFGEGEGDVVVVFVFEGVAAAMGEGSLILFLDF